MRKKIRCWGMLIHAGFKDDEIITIKTINKKNALTNYGEMTYKRAKTLFGQNECELAYIEDGKKVVIVGA